MNFGKVALSIIWVLCIVAFFLPPGSNAAYLGRMLFWVLVVIHAIECAVFFRKLEAAEGPLLHHLAQTFAFGFVHLREVQSGETISDPNP